VYPPDAAVLLDASSQWDQLSEYVAFSWDSSNPCALCEGVECDENGRVTALDLSPYFVYGSIPSDIGNLSALSVLDLSTVALNGPIPSSIGSLTRLEQLDLHSNYLSGSIPPSFTNLTTLILLDLSYNRLSGPIPHSWAT